MEGRRNVVLVFDVVVLVLFWFFGGVLLFFVWILGYFCENGWPLNKEKVPPIHTGGKGTAYFYLSSKSI